jgi:hypothetical protein
MSNLILVPFPRFFRPFSHETMSIIFYHLTECSFLPPFSASLRPLIALRAQEIFNPLKD